MHAWPTLCVSSHPSLVSLSIPIFNRRCACTVRVTVLSVCPLRSRISHNYTSNKRHQRDMGSKNKKPFCLNNNTPCAILAPRPSTMLTKRSPWFSHKSTPRTQVMCLFANRIFILSSQKHLYKWPSKDAIACHEAYSAGRGAVYAIAHAV